MRRCTAVSRYRKNGRLVFEVDCINVWNKVTMNGPAVSFGASNFGQIGGASANPGDPVCRPYNF